MALDPGEGNVGVQNSVFRLRPSILGRLETLVFHLVGQFRFGHGVVVR